MTFPFPIFMPSVVAPITTLTKIAEATSSAATVVGPATIEKRDLLVLLDFAFGKSTPTTVVPTDFTIIQNLTIGAARAILSYKIADGSEASASLTGMTAESILGKVLLVFRGDVRIKVVNVGDPSGQATGSDPTVQVITASAGVAPLVVLGAYVSDSAVNPRTMSPAKNGETSALGGVWLAWKIYNSSPADVSIDMDDEGSINILAGCYIEVASS